VPLSPVQPDLEISEGSISGYALQWFTFSAILLLGYPFLSKKQLKSTSNEMDFAGGAGIEIFVKVSIFLVCLFSTLAIIFLLDLLGGSPLFSPGFVVQQWPIWLPG